MISTRSRARRWAPATLLVLAGCGSSATTHESPSSESDPARHARAIRETEAKARADQEAERAAFRRAGRGGPAIGAG